MIAVGSRVSYLNAHNAPREGIVFARHDAGLAGVYVDGNPERIAWVPQLALTIVAAPTPVVAGDRVTFYSHVLGRTCEGLVTVANDPVEVIVRHDGTYSYVPRWRLVRAS